MKNYLTLAITTLVLAITNIATGFHFYDKGTTLGVESFHQYCYHVGGFAVNRDGQAIMCGPVSGHSQQNNQKKLDKHPEI